MNKILIKKILLLAVLIAVGLLFFILKDSLKSDFKSLTKDSKQLVNNSKALNEQPAATNNTEKENDNFFESKGIKIATSSTEKEIDTSLLSVEQKIAIDKCRNIFSANAKDHVVISITPRETKGNYEIIFYGPNSYKELPDGSMTPAVYNYLTCISPTAEQELLYSIIKSKSDDNLLNLLLNENNLIPELKPFNFFKTISLNQLKNIIIFEQNGVHSGVDLLIYTKDPDYTISLNLIDNPNKLGLETANINLVNGKVVIDKEQVISGRVSFDKILTLIQDEKTIKLEPIKTEEYKKGPDPFALDRPSI